MGDGDNQGQAQRSITIEESPKEIFKWVSSPKFTTRWIRGSKKAKKLSKGDLKVGSLIRETIKIPNASAELTGEIILLEKDKIIETEFYVSGMKLKRGEMKPVKRGDYATQSFRSRIELSKIDETHTKVSYRIQATYGRWYTRFLEPLVSNKNLENMEESLAGLKKKIEQSRDSRVKKKKAREKRSKERKAKEAIRKASKKKNKSKSLKEGINIGKKKVMNPPGILTIPKLKPMLKLNPVNIEGSGK